MGEDEVDGLRAALEQARREAATARLVRDDAEGELAEVAAERDALQQRLDALGQLEKSIEAGTDRYGGVLPRMGINHEQTTHLRTVWRGPWVPVGSPGTEDEK